MKTIRLDRMNSPDIKAAIEDGFTTAVIAVGSIEQHGPHLPISTDTLMGDALANRVAMKLGNALQAPTIAVGCSEHHMTFAGTISLREETLKSIVNDYIVSLSTNGFKDIVFLPCHGGNFKPLERIISDIGSKYHGSNIHTYSNLDEFVKAIYSASQEFGITKEEAGTHAGESETSIILALQDELVMKDRFVPGYLGVMGDREHDIVYGKGMHVLTENGVIGDPLKAEASKGEVYLDRLADTFLAGLKKHL